MEEELTIKDVLKELNENLKIKKEEEEKQKNKKFNHWLPWGAKVGKAKARKNYIIVEKIGSNGSVTYEKAQIKDGTILVDDIPRIITPGDIVFYKGKRPMVIIPDWSTVPFSKVDHFNATQIAGYGTKGWKLLYQRMKTSMIDDKKKMSGMVIWIIIAAVIGLGYMAFKGGLF